MTDTPLGLSQPSDFPNPRRVGATPWLYVFRPPDTYTTLLRGKDKFFGSPGQGPAYLSPLPVRGAGRIAYDVGVSSLALANTSAAAPFTPADWPNPRGPVRPHPAIQTPGAQALALYAAILPFGRIDWPNPARPRPLYSETFARNAALLAVTSAAAPFGQTDWPLPPRFALRRAGQTDIFPAFPPFLIPAPDEDERTTGISAAFTARFGGLSAAGAYGDGGAMAWTGGWLDLAVDLTRALSVNGVLDLAAQQGASWAGKSAAVTNPETDVD